MTHYYKEHGHEKAQTNTHRYFYYLDSNSMVYMTRAPFNLFFNSPNERETSNPIFKLVHVVLYTISNLGYGFRYTSFFNFVQLELNQNPNVYLYNINFKEIPYTKQRLMLVAMLWPLNTTDTYELQYMTKHACYM